MKYPYAFRESIGSLYTDRVEGNHCPGTGSNRYLKMTTLENRKINIIP
jgi:hypothetical protein